MTLTATNTEHSSKIDRVRQRVRDLEVKHLKCCDYMFEAHGKVVGLEVKWSISDLLASLKVIGENGGPRLAVECRKMVEFVDIPWLIVPSLRDRGDGKLLADDRGNQPVTTGWEYNSVKGILADLALYGLVVDEYDGDIAQRIAQLYYVISKKEHDWIKQRGRPEFITLDRQYRQSVWSLCAFDNWGVDSAQKALKKHSVKELASMTTEQLQKLPGVGPKMAESLYRGLNAKWS